MEIKSNKKIVMRSLLWKLMERTGVQGVQFILQIILARLLTPNDYGIISLITIFIALANVFIQSGFNTALIQKKDTTEEDFSSVFYLSLLVAGILYIILFISSPYIAKFYGIKELIPVLRVLSIILFFGAINSIQNAVVSRTMNFRKLFTSSIFSAIISGVIGIILAYLGFGVWALVAQQIINQISITIILWFTLKWRPRLVFSITRIGSLFSYGWKLLVSSLIDTLYMNLRSLIVGKVYTSEMLAFYNRGDQFPQIIVSNINGSIQSVMLPTLSLEQDNKKRVKELVRRSIVTSSFLLFPLMIGLAVIAEPLIKILLTEKWLSCVPFMQIFCLTYALWPIHTANLQAINALGRSDIYLKLEIIKKIVGTTILIISMFYGVYAIAIGGLLSGVISSFINSYPNLRLLDYSYKEQIKDIIPSLLLSIIMGGIVYSILFFYMSPYLTLIIQILVGAIVYISLAKLFKLECYEYLINTVKSLLRNKKI
ncbi:MAG: lipopolysaccharide biosynthesis protein [Clostridium sp.]|uniref:lipopolysaccharide biosynthesis protein n=1 Tax=Clostridium TaxID=1485 RepID=UPI0028FE074C|nr:lipopolysaccharide biosynthesis protein [Clostridium sp.]MDU1278878.1 lipopolysaccharide biosynthesis protein [Clostridium sp.]MDU7087505.1 lipopolysaccharide biosynthesis protein [Clostridium sp.]